MAEDERLLLALEDTVSTGVRVVGLRVLNYAVGFVASVLIARALGAEGRGLYALPIAMLGIVLALSHVGLEHANVFLAARDVSLRKLWASDALAALVVSALAWAVVAGVRVVGGPDVFGGLPDVWLAVTFVQVPFLLMSLYWTSILQLGDRFRTAVTATAVGTALQAAIVVPMFLADALTPFRVLLLGWVANGATWLLLLWAGGRAGLASFAPDRDVLRRGLAFGIRAQGATLFTFLLLRVDQVLVQRRLGFEELGLYSLAVVLAEVLFLATEPFAGSLLPHQVGAGRGDDRRLSDATARMTLVVAVLVGVVAWVAAPHAIRFAYGERFVEATWAFRWLLPGIAVLAAQRPLHVLVIKRGRIGLAAAMNASAFAINVALNLVLLGRLGIVGASVASTITYTALGVAYAFATRGGSLGAWRDLVPGRRDLARLRSGFRRRARSRERRPGPPRAVFVIGSLDRGGAEGQLIELSTALAARGWRATIVCLSEAGARADEVRAAGVEVVVGRFRGLTPKWHPFAVARVLGEIRRAVEARDPDVVHAWLYLGNLIGLWAGRRSGTPVLVGSQRSLSSTLGRRALLAPWERRCVRWADAWVCNGEAVLADAVAHGLPADAGRVIRNGVHFPERVTPIPDGAPNVLCVANLIGYKGHDVLLRAFAAARVRLGGGVSLALAGTGPEERHLRELAPELGLEDAVRYLGSVAELGPRYAACAFTVLPSRSEGMPNVVLESLAHGRAVVATSVGGTTEILADGGGILVPPDDVEALADAMVALVSDPGRCRALGEEGRRLVAERFGLDRMVSETEALYAELLLRKGVGLATEVAR